MKIICPEPVWTVLDADRCRDRGAGGLGGGGGASAPPIILEKKISIEKLVFYCCHGYAITNATFASERCGTR